LLSKPCRPVFAGLGERRAGDHLSRRVRATGKIRPSPDEGLDPDSPWRVNPQDFKFGWDSEQGKWIDIPKNSIKLWWQQPSYLTPYGYRQPPHWTRKDYALACTEMRFSMAEAGMIADLKERGMSIEEIRARASSFEFIETDKLPKMTPKLTFLFQVKALWEGKEDDLIDLDSYYNEQTGRDMNGNKLSAEELGRRELEKEQAKLKESEQAQAKFPSLE